MVRGVERLSMTPTWSLLHLGQSMMRDDTAAPATCQADVVVRTSGRPHIMYLVDSRRPSSRLGVPQDPHRQQAPRQHPEGQAYQQGCFQIREHMANSYERRLTTKQGRATMGGRACGPRWVVVKNKKAVARAGRRLLQCTGLQGSPG